MRSKAGTHLKYLCLASMFAALVVVFTAFVKIPIAVPGQHGYVHLGDGIIYFAACLLPTPYAIFAGAGGAALADVLTGGWVWVFATIPIKVVTVLCFGANGKKILTLRNYIMLIPGAIFCVFGYLFYEMFIVGTYTPLLSVPWNLGQSVVASVLFVVLGLVADKMKLKDRMEDYFII